MLSTLIDVAPAGPAGVAASLLAYLDPGSGSVVLQIAIAGILSGLYFVRSSLARIKGWAVRRVDR